MSLLDARAPYSVFAPAGKMPIWVMDQRDFSTNFALLATTAPHKVCLRVGGGCTGMSEDDRVAMLDYFAAALSGFQGLIWSGATRKLNAEGQIDPMVTEVPGVVAAANPGAVALGTAPRTDTLQIAGESRLELDKDGTLINPSLSGVLVVQDGPDNTLGWDGDVAAYVSLMERLKTYGWFEAVGLVTWNGGGVTQTEIMQAAKRGWPTLLVKGSGRKTDEFVERLAIQDRTFLDELPADHKVRVADRNDPATLRTLLQEFGFLRS